MRSPKKLWRQCKLLIPGGNGLISKRPERYSLDKWPTFYSKSKEINIWDLNNKKYTDMSQMGKIIGAVMAKADGLDGSVVSKLVREKIS